jgi:hypothetical protein
MLMTMSHVFGYRVDKHTDKEMRMRNILKSHDVALVFSSAALLSFLGRTFIDYGYVFPESGITMPDLLPITFGVLAFYGGWLLALIAAGRRRRGGLIAILVYNVLLLIFGISTLTTFCPSPCRTAWPLGEILIWSNLLIGIAATLLTARQLMNKTSGAVPGGYYGTVGGGLPGDQRSI